MKALDAAKILINLSLDNQKPITNLKLQKNAIYCSGRKRF